ncbi:hypothetical protein, partial [Neisseria sicca]|uniref:hypothetical protein n=1 Tax=Neisseria sicca TaxID=490 RepID=UPI001C99637A
GVFVFGGEVERKLEYLKKWGFFSEVLGVELLMDDGGGWGDGLEVGLVNDGGWGGGVGVRELGVVGDGNGLKGFVGV